MSIGAICAARPSKGASVARSYVNIVRAALARRYSVFVKAQMMCVVRVLIWIGRRIEAIGRMRRSGRSQLAVMRLELFVMKLLAIITLLDFLDGCRMRSLNVPEQGNG